MLLPKKGIGIIKWVCFVSSLVKGCKEDNCQESLSINSRIKESNTVLKSQSMGYSYNKRKIAILYDDDESASLLQRTEEYIMIMQSVQYRHMDLLFLQYCMYWP